MRIAEFCEELGTYRVHPTTLRRLEKRGKIPKAPRDRNGHRIFTKKHVQKVIAALTKTYEG